VHQPDPEESSDEEVDEEDLEFVRRLGAPAAAFLSALDATEAVKCAPCLKLDGFASSCEPWHVISCSSRGIMHTLEGGLPDASERQIAAESQLLDVMTAPGTHKDTKTLF